MDFRSLLISKYRKIQIVMYCYLLCERFFVTNRVKKKTSAVDLVMLFEVQHL
jgi:hypothetical protein